VFMEMPSKKDYPMYYTQIKRPMCIETVFKHLKRKEYQTSLDFANDVELVFPNALEF
ncbi:Bromodomain-containing protein, partial [Suillus fuscotomentosus]